MSKVRAHARGFLPGQCAARSRRCRLRAACQAFGKRSVESVAAAPPSKQQAPGGTAAATGSVFGAAGLITGSTVGAGILALPTVTQHAGFGPSAVMLVGSWAVLQLQALLIAETNIRCHERAASRRRHRGSGSGRVITLTEMSNLTLGAPAEAAVSSIYLVMTFTLLLAYTARAGDLIGAGLHVPASAGVAAFTGGLGSLLALGGSSGSARVSSALTAGMIVAFAAVVGQGLGQVDMAHGLEHADWGNAAVCLPVMFLSLVYHDLIPVVCKLLGWDRRRVVAALLAGSATPLAMFCAWEAVCLGLVPYSASVTIDPVDVLIQQQGGMAGAAIAVFSLAALATSGIGVALSVSNTVKRLLKAATPLRAASRSSGKAGSRAAVTMPSALDCTAIVLTLVPPAVCSLGDSNIFLTATHLAGAYGMTLLYGVLPPAMAWSCRKQVTPAPENELTDPSGRLLAGGKPVLVGLASAGLLVEGVQLVLDVPALQPSAVATSMVQPVLEVASAGLTSVSVSAAQFASSMQQPVMQML